MGNSINNVNRKKIKEDVKRNSEAEKKNKIINDLHHKTILNKDIITKINEYNDIITTIHMLMISSW